MSKLTEPVKEAYRRIANRKRCVLLEVSLAENEDNADLQPLHQPKEMMANVLKLLTSTLLTNLVVSGHVTIIIFVVVSSTLVSIIIAGYS